MTLYSDSLLYRKSVVATCLPSVLRMLNQRELIQMFEHTPHSSESVKRCMELHFASFHAERVF